MIAFSKDMQIQGFMGFKDPMFVSVMTTLVSVLFKRAPEFSRNVVKQALDPFIRVLKDDLLVYIETGYVDKVYRDSYYLYYSSKALEFPRNCIRLSFFENEKAFKKGHVIGFNDRDIVRSSYLGFMVLRPTVPKLIGRSAISPRAFKNQNFKTCMASIPATVAGFKVKVDAFPFSSQDTESITCAETTLWALMEYFGNRYPEYSPILPSNIVDILKTQMVDRQVPSNGLPAEYLSYAIKSFGFAPRLYHLSVFSNLHNILGCYVESGIPVVVGLSNRNTVCKAEDWMGHAVICAGHEVVTPDMIDAAISDGLAVVYKTPGGEIKVLDYDDIPKKFLFIDDNYPPYQLDFLSSPVARYNDSIKWKGCAIESMITPLYGKIYMEPYIAKGYIRNFLQQSTYFKHLCDKLISLRTFLCSTRSYRDYVNSSDMTDDMKHAISRIFAPKFIWIAEIADVDGLKGGYANDLIILDATSRQNAYFEPLLVAFASGTCYTKDDISHTMRKLPIETKSFKSYLNLK